MIGKCERKQIKKEEKMLKRKAQIQMTFDKKLMKGIKTTYNKIVAKKRKKEQYIIKQIQTKKKEKKLEHSLC